MPHSRPDFISTFAAWDRKLLGMRVLAFSALICTLQLGCAVQSGGGADSPSSPTEAMPPPVGGPPAAPEAASPGVEGASAGVGETQAVRGREVMPDTEPDPSRSLPEVSVRTVGLHIGGGPNDDPSRASFREAVESRFEAFLECYKTVEDPGKGGTFGVDMFIPREGGHPEVRQPRTAMGGAEFRDCVSTAFGATEFGRPPKGPTVISYSIRFEVRDPTRP